jgi:DNA-binding NtrC family response regulator
VGDENGPGAVLVVDDDPAVRASLALLLKQAGHPSLPAATPAEAVALLGKRRFDLVLMDMNFSRATSGEEGLELLREIRAGAPDVPVILMTAWASIDLAVKGMRAGASDFVTKPWTNPELLAAVRTALGLAAATAAARGAGREPPPTRAALDAAGNFAGIVGEDVSLLRILDLVARVAATDASVLITGESGTGKELVAEALHANGPRRAGPFVKVNLGGIPTSLFESEMFGHVRGAFTDARQDRKGRFELANGGTIFLDEVGDLDSASQVKLLRVLQEKTYEVLGDSHPRTVDVRVVAATNRNLREMAAAGTFREDLLYRLNLIAVELPPLRARPGDIPLLARHFAADAARRYGRPALQVPPEALRVLETLPWPGNVRQLRQVIERAALVSPRDVLSPEDLRLGVAMESNEAAPGAALPAVGTMTLDEIERAMILKSLEHHAGNVSRVAESLGLSRAALYRRFEKYGIAV